jgi:NTP pyrophosphatase (non-canonical NTP hydrolase)
MALVDEENSDERNMQLAVFALGLAGEAGEVADYIKKSVGHGHGIDKKVLIKELGDVFWYVAAVAKRLGIDLGVVPGTNIEKLRARYPDGFSHEASRNRRV